MIFGTNRTVENQKPFLRDWLSKKNKRTMDAILTTEYVVEEIVRLEKGLLIVCPEFLAWVWKSSPTFESLSIYVENASKLDSTINGIMLKVLSSTDWELSTSDSIEICCRKTVSVTGTIKYHLTFVEN